MQRRFVCLPVYRCLQAEYTKEMDLELFHEERAIETIYRLSNATGALLPEVMGFKFA